MWKVSVGIGLLGMGAYASILILVKDKEGRYSCREKEFEQFFRALSHAPLIVVNGLRRTGEPSSVNVALVECGCLFAIRDLRVHRARVNYCCRHDDRPLQRS
jgi:hypothetical protein